MHFKGDMRNSWELFSHVEMIKSHLGKGLASNVTLKEMYVGKRRLLNKIKLPDVQQFMGLLNEIKDPRYIDFLLSISTVGEDPLPANQMMISELLLNRNVHLLPTIRVDDSGKKGIRLGIHIPGSRDQHGNDFWIDVGKFGAKVWHGGHQRDLASQILISPFSELNEQQKLLRYFLRCTNLFGRLVLGRNQTAIGLLLNNTRFCFNYDDIFKIICDDGIPALVRARFMSLMLRMYVDRDPQTSKPQVLYTRTWSKVQAEQSDLDMHLNNMSTTCQRLNNMSAPTNPVCTTGFKDLTEYLLKALPLLGGAVDNLGNPSLNHATYGELELVSATVTLCDWLVDFCFFVENRNAVDADFSSIKTMISGIFVILDTLDCESIHEAVSREDLMRIGVRMQALGLLLRLFNMRANFRISKALAVWEEIFETLQPTQKLQTKLARNGSMASIGLLTMGTTKIETTFLDRLFKGHTKVIDVLVKELFGQNSISSKEIGCDVYREGKHGNDYCAKVLLNLCQYKHTEMTNLATQVLVRHMSQRTRVINDLRLAQVLVLPAAVKVYEETTFAIDRLTSLKKNLDTGRPDAYCAAMLLLERMTAYMKITPENPFAIVQKYQKIMLNRELDEPIVDLLRLNLERDTSRRDSGEREVDPATNAQRRDLFQACYNFLESLCAHGHTRAQQKLFPFLGVFSDHMGIEKLNVADTLREIVRDNVALCAQIPETFYRHFTYCILTWGRKPRWLQFFEVFLSINGNPSKRNQDMILRLLLEEKDALIDLSCDYVESEFLCKTDVRYGKKRLDLLLACDHKRKVGSLLKYHYVSVDTLARCCTGKNPANKAKIAALIPFETILDNILECHLQDDTKMAHPDIDYDALCYVKQVWTKLTQDAFWSSLDSHAVREVQQAFRLWKPEVDNNGVPVDGAKSLMQEFCDAIVKLTGRLGKCGEEAGHRIALCGAEQESDISDDQGKDLGSHYYYVSQILSALCLFFSRTDLAEYVNDTHSASFELCQRLRDEVIKLYPELVRLKLGAAKHIENVVTIMTNRGIHGKEVLQDLQFEEEEKDSDEISVQEQFTVGWGHFVHQLAEVCKVSFAPAETLKYEIKDIAQMLGSRKSHANDDFQSLKEFMKLLCVDECQVTVRNTGVKVVRAILYINPDKNSSKVQDGEYERYARNEDPFVADMNDRAFKALQVEVAGGGGVQVVVSCLSSKDWDTVLGALRLACTLLAGGNSVVQNLFHAQLAPSSSQSFFSRLQEIFHDSRFALKESKRKAKQAEAVRQAMCNAGLNPPSTTVDSSNVYGPLMTEVMKFMRRSCLGQHKNMQNVLRVQRVNRESFNFYSEAVHFMTGLEPDLKHAILSGDEQTSEAAIRGFLMLSDAMKGPNYANQQAIATSGILDLADRIMNKIKLDSSHGGAPPKKKTKANTPPKSKRGIHNKITPVLEDKENEISFLSLEEIYKQNLIRCRLKSAVIECLGSFLEGVVDESIPKQMLSTCNWMAYASQMNDCFQMRHRSDAAPVEGDFNNLVSEGLSYFFLMKFLEKYKNPQEIDELEKALQSAAHAVHFFETRKGYVEITRDGRLERVFFRLPEDGIEGGAIDNPYAALYDTEREDPDKKTKMFLENMIRLVEEEAFLDKIRASVLAFTVNQWDSIRMLAFYWGLLLHVVCICLSKFVCKSTLYVYV